MRRSVIYKPYAIALQLLFISGCRAIFVFGEIDEQKCGAGRFRYVGIPV
jgi:hypothetical protein